MKKFNWNLLAALFVFAGLSVFTSCEEEDNNNNGGLPTGNEIITENITENTTWTSDKVYQLGGRITVLDGVTLTINPGTIIKGEGGTGTNATALLVARGGKLMAEGTADKPIIFTSLIDEITPEDVAAGNIGASNLEPTLNGLWGGVIVLGKAPISASNDNDQDVAEVQIEGIPASDTNGLYGGTEAGDNSGVLKYISIRHGGTNIGAGNEINGLTLGGVGSGTIIENIEIVANQDDGIEFFGGTVNVKNLISWNVGDDAIDTDQDWTGTLENFVVITPAGHCFELDGPEGSAMTGRHTIKKGHVIAVTYDGDDVDRKSKDLINFDQNSNVNLMDIYFSAVAAGQQVNQSKPEDAAVIDAAEVTFADIVINATDAGAHVDSDTAIPGITAGTSGGADVSVFGWTWARKSGQF